MIRTIHNPQIRIVVADHIAKSCNDNQLIENGMLKLIEYKHHRGMLCQQNQTFLIEAASLGKLDLVKFFIQNKYFYSPYAMDSAAKNGHMDVLAYFTSLGLKGTVNGFYCAIESGNINVVAFLLSYHPEKCNIKVGRRVAVRTKNVEMFAFLHQ